MRKNEITNHLLVRLLLLVFMVGGVGWTASAQYCLPTYNSQCSSGDYIDVFEFSNINQQATGCGALNANNYIDYSATIIADVIAGNNYIAKCKPGPTWGQYFVLLIDLNKDQDFDDPGEFFDIGYADGGDSISTPINIPCGVTGDTTRMRLMCRYFTTPLTQADVCATGLSFGEVEDYTIVIERPTVNATISELLSPVTSCGLDSNENVTACVINCGLDTITTGTICYTLNNGTPICEPISVPIAPLDTLCYTFSASINLSATGAYDFDAYVTVPGDTFPQDDSLIGIIVDNIPVITTLPYVEDFDNNNGGWITEGNPTSWEWGAPNNIFISGPASSPNAWVTGLTSLYNPDEVSFLISPCFDMSNLTNDPFVAFSHIYNTDGFGDDGWLELTTDAGATWSKVGTASTGNNWYNDINTNTWNGNSTPNFGQWRTADHPLTGAAGSGDVRVRFVMDVDAFTEFEGFGVDDFAIRDTIWNTGVVAFGDPSNGCLLSATEPISVDVTNFGTHTVTNLSVCIVVDGAAPVCETITTPIAPGATFTYNFTATADLSTLGPHSLVSYTSFALDSITDNDTTAIPITNFPVENNFPFLETFDSGPTSWISDGAFDTWELGTPNKTVIQGAASAPNAWVTGTVGPQPYQNESDNWVESPCFDMTNIQAPWVAAQVWWNSEFSWDGVVLEYSTDGGSVWAEIGTVNDPINWYNDSTVNGLVAAGLSGNGWCGRISTNNGSNGYIQASHDIGFLGGLPSVRFRFHFGSDFSVNDDGFAFDNFGIGELPVVNLGSDTIVCDSLVLSPTLTPGRFLWSNQDTTPSITIDSTAQVILTYTNDIGLQGRDTINVEVNTTPPVSLGPDQNVCAGDTLVLSLDSTVYPQSTWTGNVTGPTFGISTSGTYDVSVTDSVGCTSTDTILATIVPLPTPNLGADTTVCTGDSICLDPGCPPTHTFVWSNGATAPVICPTIVSGYWVICTDSNNCSASDSIILTPGPAAPAAIGAFDTTSCPTISFTDNSTGTVNSWSWDFGDNNTSTMQNPTNNYQMAGNGSYTVTLIVDNQCGTDTTTFQVDINCIVSIGSGLDNQLYVWPNPNNGLFRIETVLSGNDPVKLEIVDLAGKVIHQRNYEFASGNFNEEVNLGDAAQGVYFIRFDVGGKVQIEKIVVE